MYRNYKYTNLGKEKPVEGTQREEGRGLEETS